MADGWSYKFVDGLSKYEAVLKAPAPIRQRYGATDPMDDAYSLENMHRVLLAVDAILAADPLRVFPQATAGLGKAPAGPSIVSARWDRIDIRPLNTPTSWRAGTSRSKPVCGNSVESPHLA